MRRSLFVKSLSRSLSLCSNRRMPGKKKLETETESRTKKTKADSLCSELSAQRLGVAVDQPREAGVQTWQGEAEMDA